MSKSAINYKCFIVNTFICAENETLCYCSWLQISKWKLFQGWFNFNNQRKATLFCGKSIILE